METVDEFGEINRLKRDTTASLTRSVRIVEETQSIQQHIMLALDDQGNCLERIQNNAVKIDDELTYAKRILRYLKMGFVKQWLVGDKCHEYSTHNNPTPNSTKTYKPTPTPTPTQSTSYPTLSDYTIEDTNSDEKMLIQIEKGLEILKEGSYIMRQELQRQNEHLDVVTNQMNSLQTETQRANRMF
jgi:hypothetical protein